MCFQNQLDKFIKINFCTEAILAFFFFFLNLLFATLHREADFLAVPPNSILNEDSHFGHKQTPRSLKHIHSKIAYYSSHYQGNVENLK